MTDSTHRPPASAPAATEAATDRPAAGTDRPAAAQPDEAAWPMWEVFIRNSRGLAHVHAGSLHAPDATMAVRNARDLYTRRGEGVSLWVVPSTAVTTSDPDGKGAFFESSLGKDYRTAAYYSATADPVPAL
jgi:ring-1,2-phenylacetyl-CoA epoxidase subunit PaaB